MSKTAVVIGGGISGLTVAFELQQRSEWLQEGLRVVCLESGRRAGGNISTDRQDGFLCEWGPTGFLDNAPATLTLARRLSLEERLLPAGPSAENRYIFRSGKLHPVPLSPPAFLGSGILPPGGKLRLLCEPLIGRKSGAADESVFDFAARRIGRQAASIMVDAMVSGIHAGDARRLSLRATFPKMERMEREHGSLFRALLARRREAKAAGEKAGGPAGPGGRLTSFREGLQELIDALAESLGKSLLLGSAVESISDLGRRGLRVHPVEGPPIDADAVVVSCPAWDAGRMLRSMDGDLAATLDEIPSAPLAVAHLGFRSQAIGHPCNGFGFLVPRGQGVRILGALWISSIFEGRAPEGSSLMTVMTGGAHDQDVLAMDDGELQAVIMDDLSRTMGIEARPYFQKLIRHARGIPQYTLGHPERLERIDARLSGHPSLFLSGNSYRGISVNACIEEAPGIAERLLEHLSR
jgi:oxygen-dependent protoporphyrinogen oxidase